MHSHAIMSGEVTSNASAEDTTHRADEQGETRRCRSKKAHGRASAVRRKQEELDEEQTAHDEESGEDDVPGLDGSDSDLEECADVRERDHARRWPRQHRAELERRKKHELDQERKMEEYERHIDDLRAKYELDYARKWPRCSEFNEQGPACRGGNCHSKE